MLPSPLIVRNNDVSLGTVYFKEHESGVMLYFDDPEQREELVISLFPPSPYGQRHEEYKDVSALIWFYHAIGGEPERDGPAFLLTRSKDGKWSIRVPVESPVPVIYQQSIT